MNSASVSKNVETLSTVLTGQARGGFITSCFGSSPVSVAFVYKQSIYNCAATENEFIVYYEIWCILSTKLSNGLTLP